MSTILSTFTQRYLVSVGIMAEAELSASYVVCCARQLKEYASLGCANWDHFDKLSTCHMVGLLQGQKVDFKLEA